MTNLADVTLFFNAVWVASPLQGEGEGEGCLHGNVCMRLRTPFVLSPLSKGRGGKARPSTTRISSASESTMGANTRFPVGSVGNPNGLA